MFDYSMLYYSMFKCSNVPCSRVLCSTFWSCHKIRIIYIFWSAYVRDSWIVTFFSVSFSEIYFWKKIVGTLSHIFWQLPPAFLSLDDDPKFFMNDRIFFFVIQLGSRTWWLEKRVFFVSPFLLLDFFFFPIYGVSTALGSGWTVSSEFTTVLLLDIPCKSIFLSAVLSFVSASIFYIGSSITEITNRSSMRLQKFSNGPTKI